MLSIQRQTMPTLPIAATQGPPKKNQKLYKFQRLQHYQQPELLMTKDQAYEVFWAAIHS